MKLNTMQFNSLLRRIIKEEKSKKKSLQENFEVEEFRTRDLMNKDPEAYEALDEHYKADDSLTFYYDVNGNLCAEHDLYPDELYVWDTDIKEWIQGDSGRYFESKTMKTKTTLSENKHKISVDYLIDNEYEAYEQILNILESDIKYLNFYYDTDHNLYATHMLGKENYKWIPKQEMWVQVDVNESKTMKTKTTLSEVRKVIREEVVRYSVKQKLTEAVKRYFRLNEMVSWKNLEGELKTAYDHFKAENPGVKIGDFDFKKVTDSFINDKEARQMMKDGDADGLVNKAMDVLGADVVGDTDVEQHQEDVFANLERSDDDEVGAAFDKMTKKVG